MKGKILLWIIAVLILIVNQVYGLTIDDNNLIAFLPLNETKGNLTDYSTSSTQYNFTSKNGAAHTPTYRQTGIGWAEFTILFDGIDDYFQNTVLDDFMESERTHMTVGAMIRTTGGMADRQSVIGWRDSTAGGDYDGGGIAIDDPSCSAGDNDYNAAAITANSWNCADSTGDTARDICIVARYNSTHVSLWINGSQVDSQAGTQGTGWHSFQIANYGQLSEAADEFIGRMGGVAIWNESLSPSDISSYCSVGILQQAPAADSFRVTMTDLYSGNTLNNFTIYMVNSTTSIVIGNTTGAIDVYNVNGLFNITVSSNNSRGYFNNTWYNYNVSTDLAGSLHQVEVNISSYQAVSGLLITDDTPYENHRTGASTPNQFNLSVQWYDVCGGDCEPADRKGKNFLLLTAGHFNITGNHTGYVNNTISYNFEPLSKIALNFTFGTNRLKINATDIINNVPIKNFTIVLGNGSYIVTKNTNDYNTEFDLIDGTYLIQFQSGYHSWQNTTVNITSGSLYPNLTLEIYTLNSVNFTIYDEILGKTNFFNGTPVNIELVSGLSSKNYSTSTGKLYLELLSPAPYRVSYSATGYKERDYYFTLTNQSHNEIDLYLLSDGNSTDITITAQDENAREVTNATVKLLRYYIDSNSYITVAMANTDENGKAELNVDLYDAFYYYIVEKDTVTYLTTSPTRIIDTEATLSVSLNENVLTSRQSFNGMDYSLTYNNVTDQFRFTWNDPTNLVKDMCLEVRRRTFQNNFLLCNNCTTTSSGTLFCSINSSESGTFVATAKLETTTKNSPYILAVESVLSKAAKSTVNLFGETGVYITSYVIMALALLGTPFPYISITLSIIGLIFASLMGILGLGYGSIASVIIIGSLVLYKVRK